MPARISNHSLSKKGKVGKLAFKPDLEEWKKACGIYAYDRQIFEHFDIARETFYSFLDKERYKKEQGEKSDYIDFYKSERNKTKQQVLHRLLDFAKNGDTACTIFSAKVYGGLIEAKDVKQIELRKIEVQLKMNAFLTELAKSFNLSPEKLDHFAKNYFKNELNQSD